jgi:hypothetical protein
MEEKNKKILSVSLGGILLVVVTAVITIVAARFWYTSSDLPFFSDAEINYKDSGGSDIPASDTVESNNKEILLSKWIGKISTPKSDTDSTSIIDSYFTSFGIKVEAITEKDKKIKEEGNEYSNSKKFFIDYYGRKLGEEIKDDEKINLNNEKKDNDYFGRIISQFSVWRVKEEGKDSDKKYKLEFHKNFKITFTNIKLAGQSN